MGEILILAVSSGLIAGVISSLTSAIIAFFERKSEKKLEHQKYLNSLNDFRYKHLHEYLQILVDFPSFQVGDDPDYAKTWIQQSHELQPRIRKYYILVKPLLDKSISTELEKSYEELRVLNSHYSSIYHQETGTIELDITPLVRAREHFKLQLIDTVQIQLIKLLHTK